MNTTKVRNTQNTISTRNPFEDGKEANLRADLAVQHLSNNFDSVERIGRKRLYKINNSFYVVIISAPSSLRLEPAIVGLMKKSGKLPYYILFTREPNTYPEKSIDSYYGKIKSIYKKSPKPFMGCILGLEEFKSSDMIFDMKSIQRVSQPDFKRFDKIGARVSLDTAISSIGLSRKQLRELSEILRIYSLTSL
jgi:hypothetical protein